MSTSTDRMRAHRQRLAEISALESAAMARELPVKILAGEFLKLERGQRELLKWNLAAVTASGDTGGSKRKRLDAYFTKPPVAAAVTRRVHQLVGKVRSILEPSAGLGAFVRSSATTWPGASITAVDIRIRRPLRLLGPAVGLVHLDFLKFPARGFDLVIGNPPFNAAEAHVRHALQLLAPGGHLAVILRMGFVAGVERWAGLYREPGLPRLRHWAPIVPRPSFLETGTDQCDYSLYVWQRGYTGIRELGDAIEWREPEPSSSAELLERGAA